MSRSTYALAGAIALLAATTSANAQLRVVNVRSPAVNCVFSPSCVLAVFDEIGTIPITGIAGSARLLTRPFTGSAGSPAAGLYGYVYRVDLTYAAGITFPACVSRLRIDFGPPTPLNYDRVGPLDHVFVITTGAVGTIGLASAVRAGRIITFNFTRGICTGASVGRGQSSFFFGLASAHPLRPITAQAYVTPDAAWLSVPAYAPGL